MPSLTNGLTVETKGGKSIRLNGLSKRASEALHDAVQRDIDEPNLDLAATAEAQALSPELTALANATTSMLPAGRYIRQSQAERVVEASRAVSERCTDRVHGKLDEDTTAAIQQINVAIAILLDDDPLRSVTVPITVTNQNGAPDADYSGIRSDVTFNSEETRLTITLKATDDSEVEDGENVALSAGDKNTACSNSLTHICGWSTRERRTGSHQQLRQASTAPRLSRVIPLSLPLPPRVACRRSSFCRKPCRPDHNPPLYEGDVIGPADYQPG